MRADDNEESLRKVRLMEYYKKTAPLMGYYYAKGLMKRVDGLGSLTACRKASKGSRLLERVRHSRTVQ